MEERQEHTQLSDKEIAFCELLIIGDSAHIGQPLVCYKDVFGDTENLSIAAHKLLNKPHIAQYIKEITELRESEIEHKTIKLQVAETLRNIMQETSQGEYTDKFGVPLSPASLRAVSVNAAKALMDIYPIKNANQSNESGNNKQGGNVVFNVISPQIVTNNDTKPEDPEQ